MESQHKTAALIGVGLFLIGVFVGRATQKGGASTSGGGPTLAVVNGSPITAGAFSLRLEGMPPLQRQVLLNAHGGRQLLDNLVLQELMLQDARKRGLASDPSLASQVEGYRDSLLTHKLYEDLFRERVHVSEADLKSYYDQNRAMYVRPAPKGKKPAPMTFEEARPQVEQQVTTLKRSQVLQGYLKDLRDKARVQVNEEKLNALLASLRTPLHGQGEPLAPAQGSPAPHK